MIHALAVAAGPRAGITQGNAIFQQQRGQSLGKGLGESPKTGCTPVPEVLELCLRQGPKCKAQQLPAGGSWGKMEKGVNNNNKSGPRLYM